MWYNLDIQRLAHLLMPTFLRKEVMMAWITALVSPLEDVVYNFNQNRLSNIYKVEHNWQVCYMEAALNDSFDIQDRRITIDEDLIEREYIYTSGENQPKYLGTKYIRNSWEFDDNIDFIVNMHGVSADLFDVRALVDFYRLDGTRYKVINLT